jgi:ABC-type antimicrobial peptide transport system permease subunit
VINTLVFPVSEVVSYLIVAILAGVVAAFYPARKASKMNVLEAIATT